MIPKSLGKGRLISFPVIFILVITLLIGSNTSAFSQEKKLIQLEDQWLWKAISQQTISDNGSWVAYSLKPNYGSGELIIRNVDNDTEYKIPRGTRPVFTNNSKWLGCIVTNPEDEHGEKDKKVKEKFAYINLESGEIKEVDNVSGFKFVPNGIRVAIKLLAPEANKDDKSKDKKKTGTDLLIMNIEQGMSMSMNEVVDYVIDEKSKFIMYTVSSADDAKDGIYYLDMSDLSTGPIITGKGKYKNLTWNKAVNKLAFVSDKDSEDEKDPIWKVYSWDPEFQNAEVLINPANIEGFPEGMEVPENARLKWTEDSKTIFLNIRKDKPKADETDKKKLPGVDIWHWKDSDIQPTQAKQINRLKNKSYASAYKIDSKTFFQMADDKIPNVSMNKDMNFALGSDNSKQRSEQPWFPPAWDTPTQDYYVFALADGSKKLALEQLKSRVRWSNGGKYLYWFLDEDWFAYSIATGEIKNLTENVKSEFRDIHDDHPGDLPSWGTGGWTENDKEVLIYDEFDIWSVPVEGGVAENITGGEGKRRNSTFRLQTLDRDQKFVDMKKPLTLSFVNNNTMAAGYYRLRNGSRNPIKLIEMEKKIGIPVKAKGTDRLLFTIQTFEQFPDLHVSGVEFKDLKKISDGNPQQKDYIWGDKAELIEWRSADGDPLKGVLYYPADYEPGKKYPLVLYIYELMASNLHTYFPPISNHRFNSTEYTSHGYAVLKPDIIYKEGLPGPSSVKCVVPAVQKVIDMGIADPERIGIQGHSWGAYEVCYIMTQTDIFSAVCAGAPVSNMTSAYGGIRTGSGFPRTFQYETGQSRIGKNLWEKPELYIENSPLFFADRVNTPLLMHHGDDDGAVPWDQSVEYYLALRRLDKVVYFLQYNGEPHHLQKKPNRDDWTVKMMQFFDHYLKDKQMPEWMEKGVSILDKGKK